MESHPLSRYFEVHGVKLPDPNPALSVELFVHELAAARLEQILWGNRVIVAHIPGVYQLPVGGVCDVTANPIELLRLDPCGQWPPAITVPKQNDEVRLDAGLLAAFNLAQAYLHGLLIECRLIADTPSPGQWPGTPVMFRVLSTLAEGPDRLVVHEVLNFPASRLDVVLPLEKGDYVQHFETPDSKTEFTARHSRNQKQILRSAALRSG